MYVSSHVSLHEPSGFLTMLMGDSHWLVVLRDSTPHSTYWLMSRIMSLSMSGRKCRTGIFGGIAPSLSSVFTWGTSAWSPGVRLSLKARLPSPKMSFSRFSRAPGGAEERSIDSLSSALR